MSGLLIWFFGAIGQFLTSLQGSLAATERIFEILDLDDVEYNKEELFVDTPQVNVKMLKDDYHESAICIEFKNVTFSYNGSEEILKDVSFKVRENTKVAFVGESGGGKSTILKLLLGFYEPQNGEIYIFGKSIREYTKWQLRKPNFICITRCISL